MLNEIFLKETLQRFVTLNAYFGTFWIQIAQQFASLPVFEDL